MISLMGIARLGRRLKHSLPIQGASDDVWPEIAYVPESLAGALFPPATTTVDDQTDRDDQQDGQDGQQCCQNCSGCREKILFACRVG